MSGLIVQDFTGANNSALAATSARLIRGGSWRRQRVVVVIPTDELMPAKVALSLWNLIFPPNQGVVRILAQGMEVGDAYSKSLEAVVAHPELSQFEYLLTVEHDNLPPQDGALLLIESLEANPHLSAVGGLYFTKGEGGVAQIWGDPKDPVVNFRPQVPRDGELIECCGTGMGFTMFRLSMFKDERLQRPWFRTLASKDGVGTQDLAFWSMARCFGYRCAVDCRCKVGHLDIATGMVW